jgi:uncharacterized phage infection (PIP) family protein YhgE
MTDNEHSKFKMRLDDESPDLQFKEEIEDQRVKKLSRRITIISIIIPCLIGVILFFVYRDLKMRVGIIHDTGTTEVKTLSKELESRFSSLSVKQADLENALNKRIESLEKTTASLQTNLKEATTAIKNIRSARKKDNIKTVSAVEAINKTLSPIPKDLENIASDIKNVDQKFARESANISQMIAGTKNDLQKINADIAAFSINMVDQKALDLALKNHDKTYQQAMRQLTSDLEAKIKSVEKKIQKLEKAEALSERQKHKPAPVTEPKPAKQTVAPKPGTIIEQDIQ